MAILTESKAVIDAPKPKITERSMSGGPGLPLLGLGLLLCGIALLLETDALLPPRAGVASSLPRVVGALAVIVACLIAAGLTAVAPCEARVVELFGDYQGTVRTSGLRWMNPLARRKIVSTRIRNHETAIAKVNDADGNPIEIAAVVVWRIDDTARAVYEVDDVAAFVGVQTETAVRHVATSYPYDGYGSGSLSLRENAEEITAQLSAEITRRVVPTGVKVIESRITRLAYAPEIAAAMLRRQQASAMVAARQRVVEGAVGMVELALRRLEEHDVVELDMERKAAMVSNLLVVLCGDHPTVPVINSGTLYQ